MYNVVVESSRSLSHLLMNFLYSQARIIDKELAYPVPSDSCLKISRTSSCGILSFLQFTVKAVLTLLYSLMCE